MLDNPTSIKQIFEAIEEAGYVDTDYWIVQEDLKGGDLIWRELKCRNMTYLNLKPNI